MRTVYTMHDVMREFISVIKVKKIFVYRLVICIVSRSMFASPDLLFARLRSPLVHHRPYTSEMVLAKVVPLRVGMARVHEWVVADARMLGLQQSEYLVSHAQRQRKGNMSEVVWRRTG